MGLVVEHINKSFGQFQAIKDLSMEVKEGAIFVCAWISARIYRFGVLMYGQRPGLGQLAKLVRAK